MNPFLIALVALEALGGAWYVWHGKPLHGLLWALYGAATLVLEVISRD